MEMKSDRRLDMEQALEGVKPKYRQVLVLKYYKDMTLAEIAEVLDKPEGTVKTWLNKGLKQLRDRMKRKGIYFMAESEEKLLNDYFQRIDVEAEEIPDVKLDAAIRKGMQQGSHKDSLLEKIRCCCVGGPSHRFINYCTLGTSDGQSCSCAVTTKKLGSA